MGENAALPLPPADSPTLALSCPMPIEKRHIDLINGESFKGRLSLSAYLRREDVLSQQALTRNGGSTVWILIDTAEPTPPDGQPRRILSSCETIRKCALVKPRHGALKEVISHGIGSVFCNSEYRRRGYTRRMMRELGDKLNTWQQVEGQTTTFTVLYSDIGKKFYSEMGWEPFPSTHISLPPLEKANLKVPTYALPPSSPLYAADLEQLCRDDEMALRRQMEDGSTTGTLVALVPDARTMQWHHAREEFVATELLDRHPQVKGALATFQDDKSSLAKRVSCIWARIFGSDDSEDVLYILRVVVPDGTDTVSSDESERIEEVGTSPIPQCLAVAAVLRAAQLEAARWGMKTVRGWNPTELVTSAAKVLDPTVRVIERQEQSITSLRWHSPGLDEPDDKVEWLGNERFGWC